MKVVPSSTDSKVKFRLPMIFTIYELAKAGVTENAIASTIGISQTSILNWKKRYKVVREALAQGQAVAKNKEAAGDFYNFIAGRLPPDLYDLWNELLEADDDPSAISRLEKLIALHGRKARQRLFLHALVHFNFNLGRACRFVHVQRSEFHRWKTSDVDFANLIDEMVELKGDFYEHALIQLIRQGNTPAIIHANKTYNAKRGYSVKMDVNVSGEVKHTHVVKVSELNLPFDVRVAMLEAIRMKREEEARPDLIELKAIAHDED